MNAIASITSLSPQYVDSFRCDQDSSVTKQLGQRMKSAWDKALKALCATNIIFNSIKGIDKVLQLTVGVLIIPQVLFPDSKSSAMATVVQLNNSIRTVKSAVGARRFTDDLYAYATNKASIATAFALVGNSAETLMWLDKYDLFNADKAGEMIGRIPLFGKITKHVGLLEVKNAFQLTGLAFATAHELDAINKRAEAAKANGLKGDAKTNTDNTVSWLNLVGHVGKIGLIAFSAFWFSIPFAALLIVSGTAGLARMVYVARQEINDKTAPAA